MTEYYEDQLEEALVYQDYIMDLFARELHISVSLYGSKLYQQKMGESAQGIEIKFDKKYHLTGNLYIETAEKTHPSNPEFVTSGIYRNDNKWLYCIGDYQTVYIFGKKWLRRLVESVPLQAVSNPTSKGFLIGPKYQEHALHRIETERQPLQAMRGTA